MYLKNHLLFQLMKVLVQDVGFGPLCLQGSLPLNPRVIYLPGADGGGLWTQSFPAETI